MAARIIDVCDAVVARLRAGNPGLAVERTYGTELPETLPTTRGVYVYPSRYGKVRAANRRQDEYEFEVGVVVSEVFDVPVPTATTDDLLLFCQNGVFNSLQDARTRPLLPPPCEAAWPTEGEVVSAVDPDMLAGGRFFCEMRFVFHEIS